MLCSTLLHMLGMLAERLSSSVAPARLQECAIQKRDDSLVVLCSASQKNRFMECDDGKNVFGGLYHVREPESQRLSMTFHEFAQCAQRWQTRQVYLKVSSASTCTSGSDCLQGMRICDLSTETSPARKLQSGSRRRPSWSTAAAARRPWASPQFVRSWNLRRPWAQRFSKSSKVRLVFKAYKLSAAADALQSIAF